MHKWLPVLESGSEYKWGIRMRINEQMTTELESAWAKIAETTAIKGAGRKISPPIFYRFLRWTAQPLMRILGAKWNGLNNIPSSGPAIIAANHLSHVDPLYLISASRRTTHYLTKDDHFHRPHTAWFMRATGQIETARESGAIEALSAAIDILDAGNVLGIFPEGTRSKRTEEPFLLPGKTGVARVASSHPDVPVIPVGLTGTREKMAPKTDKIPKLWKKATFNFGQPITWHEWLAEKEGGGHSTESLLELAKLSEAEIRDSHAKLCRKFTDQLMCSLSALGAP
jgi:1-acyl-sn-glycerol-3-phosphate acyltransferase